MSVPSDHLAPGAAPLNAAGGNETQDPIKDVFDDLMGIEGEGGKKVEQGATSTAATTSTVTSTVTATAEVTAPVIDPNAPTAEQIQAYNEQQAAAYDKWLSSQYQIPEEALSHFTPEQAPILQNFAKTVHKNAVAEVLSRIQAALPAVFKQQMEAVQQSSKVETDFSTAYPKVNMKDPVHVAQLKTVAELVAKNRPNLSLAERIKAVGDLAYMTLGLQNDVATANQPSQPQSNEPFPNIRAMGGGLNPVPNAQDKTKTQFETVFDDIAQLGLS